MLVLLPYYLGSFSLNMSENEGWMTCWGRVRNKGFPSVESMHREQEQKETQAYRVGHNVTKNAMLFELK